MGHIYRRLADYQSACVSVSVYECECVHMHPDKVITKVTAQVG